MTKQELLEAALALTPLDRAWLVEHILESLGEPRFASDEIEQAWVGEIQRRSIELDVGTAELVEWPDVRARIAARRAAPDHKIRRVRLLRGAEVEMFRAAGYYDEDRANLGEEFLHLLEQMIDDIARTPSRWPPPHDWHRQRAVSRFPSSIVYRLFEFQVVIVAIAHHKRAPDRHRR